VSTAPTTEPTIAKPKLGAVLLIDDEKPLIELFAEALPPISSACWHQTREAGYNPPQKAFKVVVCDHLMPAATA